MAGPVNLNQKITLWRVIGENGSGGYLYSAPTVVDGKFALTNETFINEGGESAISKAVFYTEESFIANESYVFFGESAELTPPEDADLVRAVKQNPSMFGELRKGLV